MLNFFYEEDGEISSTQAFCVSQLEKRRGEGVTVKGGRTYSETASEYKKGPAPAFKHGVQAHLVRSFTLLVAIGLTTLRLLSYPWLPD